MAKENRMVSGVEHRRAVKKAYSTALRDAMTMMFFALMDKEGMTAEDLLRIRNETEEVSATIAQGYATFSDYRRVLREEYDITFSK